MRTEPTPTLAAVVPATTCSRLAETPETDEAGGYVGAQGVFYRSAVAAWHVPIEFARRMERERDTLARRVADGIADGRTWVRDIIRERNNLRLRVTELEIVADLAAGLDTGQDCDPSHHGLVCAAMAALNHSENSESSGR